MEFFFSFSKCTSARRYIAARMFVLIAGVYCVVVYHEVANVGPLTCHLSSDLDVVNRTDHHHRRTSLNAGVTDLSRMRTDNRATRTIYR